MGRPTLYIIAGCNGAGKTTASMVVLPEILDCREFVNADEIAKGLSPEMAERRVETRVASGGHDIPVDVIHRRYWQGLQNLFSIFVPIVDLWSMYDTSDSMKPIAERNLIIDEAKFSKIQQSCQNKKK